MIWPDFCRVFRTRMPQLASVSGLGKKTLCRAALSQ